MKGKNETDHNTIITEIKINNPRQPIYLEKRKIKNTDGWKKFNKSIYKWASENKEDENLEISYEKFERQLKQDMLTHIGKKRIRVDKPSKPSNDEIKKARTKRKNAKNEFEEACKSGDSNEKKIKKEKERKKKKNNNNKRKKKKKRSKERGKKKKK